MAPLMASSMPQSVLFGTLQSVAPRSPADMPIRTNAALNFALVDASRMSAASASDSPPPAAAPLTEGHVTMTTEGAWIGYGGTARIGLAVVLLAVAGGVAYAGVRWPGPFPARKPRPAALSSE